MALSGRWFRRGWFYSKVGLGAVLIIFIVSAMANFEAGLALSGDTATAVTLGLASIAVDLMKSVAFFIVASAAMNRRWPSMLAAMLIFVLCATWSLRSATQFMWSTMSQHAAERHLAVSVAKSEGDLLAVKTQRAGFLSQQSIKVGERGNRSARIDAIGENRRTAAEFNSLIRDIEAQQQKLKHSTPPVAEDPLASVLKLPEKAVFTGTALIFALILEVVSSVGFWAIVQSRRPRLQIDTPESIKPVQQEVPIETPIHRGVLALINSQMPPMPQVTSNVIAFKPKLEVVGAHSPKAPESVAEDVDPAVGEIQQIVRARFESMPGERWLYKSVVDLINSGLPKEKRIVIPYLYGTVIMPALLAEFPDVTKAKVGGRVYLNGLRPRSLEAREGTSNG